MCPAGELFGRCSPCICSKDLKKKIGENKNAVFCYRITKAARKAKSV